MSSRLDKYVWAVRIAKTRSKATELVNKRKVLLNKKEAKPSKEVRVGDEISLLIHNAVLEFKVVQLLEKRVGAKLVSEYLLDNTSAEELDKLKVYRQAQQAYRSIGEGKPTKKDRREIDDFINNWE